MNEFSLFYTLYPLEYKEKLKDLISLLLKQRLIVCANILPSIESFYLWGEKNNICNEKEMVILLKTLSSKRELMQSVLERKHPYDVPCVIELNAKVNGKYLEYLIKSLKTNLKKE